MASDATKSLERNALALHANTAISSALGFLFLVVAANLYDKDALGQDLALLSAMMLLAAVSELNFGLALPKLLPQFGTRTGRAVALSYLSSGAVGLVLSVAFVLIAPRVSSEWAFLGNGWFLAATFCIAVIVWNVFAVQDAVLTALRRAIWVPIENGVFGLAKLILMVVWAGTAIEHGVFFATIVPMAILVLPVSFVLFKTWIPRHAESSSKDVEQLRVDDPVEKRKLYRYLGLDYAASLFVHGSTSVLPIVVFVILGGEANASFGIAFTIVTAVEQLALNVGVSMTVEGSFDRSALAKLVRHSLFRFGAVMVPAILVVTAAAPLALWPFQNDYVDTATTVLRFMLLGCIPQAVIIIYQAIERVRGNAHLIIVMSATRMFSVLAGVILLAPEHGLTGVGWAWLGAHSVLALMVVPSIRQATRIPKVGTRFR